MTEYPVPARVTVEIPGWLASLADRGIHAVIVLITLAAAGFVALGIAWAGVAARLTVGLQVPFVVSGALGGAAVTGAFLALTGIHLDRRASAAEAARLQQVMRDIARIGESLPALLTLDKAAPTFRVVLNHRTAHLDTCRMVALRDLPEANGALAHTPGIRACRICNPPIGN